MLKIGADTAALFNNSTNKTSAFATPASEAQISYALALSDQLGKGWCREELKMLDKSEVSKSITAWKKERDGAKGPDPKPFIPTGLETSTALKQLELGLYLHAGDVYQVVENKDATKRYAKKRTGPRSFKYAPGAIFDLKPEMKVTAASAKKYAKNTGVCIFCGLELTDERSVTAGYGPSCAEKNGLPWG